MYKKSYSQKNDNMPLAKEINDVNERVMDAANDKVDEIMSNLEKAANSAGRRAREIYTSVSDNAAQANRAISQQIKDKPLQSALIALGAGVVLGALFRR